MTLLENPARKGEVKGSDSGAQAIHVTPLASVLIKHVIGSSHCDQNFNRSEEKKEGKT